MRGRSKMKKLYPDMSGRLSFAVMAVAVVFVLVLMPAAVKAQGDNNAGASAAGAVEETKQDAADAGVFEQDAAEQKAKSESAVELESLRGLPYLTIEDTLRHKRELVGAVDPLKPDVSLMFTSWEHALLREMKKKVAVARPASQREMQNSTEDGKPRPKGIREISLGGIVFADKDDWTIWLNNQRVTPDALPKEILDMRVTDDYVEMKWFDGYTNLVFPLRLRPHQRFNLDNRIFLPGTAAGSL